MKKIFWFLFILLFLARGSVWGQNYNTGVNYDRSTKKVQPTQFNFRTYDHQRQTLSGTSVTLDWTYPEAFIELSGNTTITFSNIPTDTNLVRCIYFLVKGDGARTLTFNDTITWFTDTETPRSGTTEFQFIWNGNSTIFGRQDVTPKTSLYLIFPHVADETGAVLNTNKTSAHFGHALFSGTAAKTANYVEYRLNVPRNINTAIDLKAYLSVVLSAADTSAHTYEISMASVPTSSSYTSPTLGNAVTLTVTADATGASEDVEATAATTLTSWKSNVTAGQTWVIRLARDGSNDASTVASYDAMLEIEFGTK